MRGHDEAAVTTGPVPGEGASGKTVPGPRRSLFIVGASRSGTEMLRSMLNRHPQVHIAAETHYFADLRPRIDADSPGAGDLARAGAFFARLRRGAYGLDGQERDDANALDSPLADPMAVPSDAEDGSSLRGVDALFRRHCLEEASRSGRDPRQLAVWGEKTPRHVFHGDDILSAMPDAHMIVLIRDPRGVAASYRDWQNHWLDRSRVSDALGHALDREERRVRASYSATNAALAWRAAILAGEDLARRHGPGRVRMQRFESLLADPDRELASVCRFLDIPPVPDMAKVARRNSSYGPAGAASGPDPAVAREWRRRLSAPEAWWVEKVVGALLDRHGYEAGRAGPFPGFMLGEMLRALWRIPLTLAVNRNRQSLGVMASRVALAVRRR